MVKTFLLCGGEGGSSRTRDLFVEREAFVVTNEHAGSWPGTQIHDPPGLRVFQGRIESEMIDRMRSASSVRGRNTDRPFERLPVDTRGAL